MTTTRISPRFQKFLLVLSGLFIALRLFYWFNSNPNPDEAYYWLWGQFPGLSYFDHPPLQAWLQGLSSALFGNSLFSLRLVNFFTSIGLLWIFYRYLKPLMREQTMTALLLSFVLMLASPVMFAFLATAWPDNVMLFTSSLAIFAFLRFFDGYLEDGHGHSRWLYLAMFSLGLAAISKYNSVFVAIGILATLISNRRLRGLWREPRLYFSVVFTLVAMAPIILWNLQHHMASIRYQLMDRSVIGKEQNTLSLIHGTTFTLALIFTLSPIVTWLAYKLLKQRKLIQERFAGREHYIQIPLWIFIISSATFIVFSLFNPMLYYWNIVAYPFMFPLLAVFLLSVHNFPKAIIAHSVYGLLFTLLVIFHTVYNPITAYVDRTGDQDSRMLYGWKQLTPIIEKELGDLKKRYPQVVMITTGYRKASILAFNSGIKNVVCISKRTDQFDFWQQGKEYGDKTALILYDDWTPIDAQLRHIYSSIKLLKTVEIRHHGLFIKRYYLAIGRNPPPKATSP